MVYPTYRATLCPGLLCSTLWPVVSKPLALGLCSGRALDLSIFLFLFAGCPIEAHLGPGDWVSLCLSHSPRLWPRSARPVVQVVITGEFQCQHHHLSRGILGKSIPLPRAPLSLEKVRREPGTGLGQPLRHVSLDVRVTAKLLCPALPAVLGWPRAGGSHTAQPGGEASLVQRDECN